MVNPGETLRPGQIYDSNRSTLLASLNERGFPAADIGIASDDRENLVKMIGKGLAEHDVIVTSGGVSMGEKVSLLQLQRHAWESSCWYCILIEPNCFFQPLGFAQTRT